MNKTRDMVEAFQAKTPPEQVGTVAIRQFELTDPDDEESPIREIASKEVTAAYCWRFDVTGVTYWIGQADDAKMLAALKPAMVPEPNSDELTSEDLGPVVGIRAKVRLDGKTLAYGPVDLHDKEWQRLQTLVVT